MKIKYIPAGTGTVTFFLCTVEPFPWHSTHLCFIYILDPSQYRQVDLIMKGPLVTVSKPVPSQKVHRVALVPSSHLEPLHFGHVSTTFTWMSLLVPLAACANDILTTTCTKLI